MLVDQTRSLRFPRAGDAIHPVLGNWKGAVWSTRLVFDLPAIS